jgi:putative FmdB family regulatory protein
MPNNVYKCEDGHKTELLQTHKDEPLKVCPKCGKPVKKIISSTSFRFVNK